MIEDTSIGRSSGSQPLANAESFRAAMRQWAAGVTVVASALEGVRHGMTVSSFTSISAVPPMILISLDRTTRTHDLILEAGIFAVSVLAADQVALSEQFAGRGLQDDDRFAGVSTFTRISGAPFIHGGLAFFDCRVTAVQEAGTSTVFLAEVLLAETVAREEPLVYANRSYFKLQK